MRNLKLYVVIPQHDNDLNSRDEISPEDLDAVRLAVSVQNEPVVPVNSKLLLETGALEESAPAEYPKLMKFTDWVLVARQHKNPRHIMFYNIDANPDHKRHTFGDRYDRAFRFNTDNVMDVYKIVAQLNEAEPRRVLDSIYAPQALSEAFNLPEEELTDEHVFFQLIPSTIVVG